jgi:aldehyde dehydrogenase (NAD+)
MNALIAINFQNRRQSVDWNHDQGMLCREREFHVKNDMTIAREEISGPSSQSSPTRAKRMRSPIANDTEYGLHAYMSGTDIQRARRVASQNQASRVAINGLLDDQQAPFGRFRHSGVGRDLASTGSRRSLSQRPSLSDPERKPTARSSL